MNEKRMFPSQRAEMERHAATRETVGAEMCAWLDTHFPGSFGKWNSVVSTNQDQVILSVKGSKVVAQKVMSVARTQFTRNGERRIVPPVGWAVVSSRQSSGRGQAIVVMQRIVRA